MSNKLRRWYAEDIAYMLEMLVNSNDADYMLERLGLYYGVPSTTIYYTLRNAMSLGVKRYPHRAPLEKKTLI